MADCPWSMRDASSPPRMRHPVRERSGPGTGLRLAFLSRTPIPWVRLNSPATVPEPLQTKMDEAKEFEHDTGGEEVAAMTVSAPARKPTLLQRERWKAVQEAKRRGLSIRGMARELGIHRETVTRYIDANSPPTRRPQGTPPAPTSDTIAD